MDLIRFRSNTLADGAVVFLEETVENAVRPAGRSPDIDQAHQFGGIDGDVAGLLRDQHVAAQDGGVVDHVVVALALEVDGGRRKDFLAPETIECRELRILETRDVDALVELERSGDGLAHHDIGATE